MDIVYHLAEYVVRTSFEDLPSQTVDSTKRFILDTLGVAIAGSSAAGVREVVEQMVEWEGRPQSTIICYGNRVPDVNAAFANSVMIHARQFDDTHDGAVVHANVTVLPTVMAISERVDGITGREFLCALVLGMDLNCRLGLVIGNAFIAGADIDELKEMNQWDMMDYLSTLSQQLYTDFGNLELPVIAMINGYCFGGGLELALACDIRIASEDASFGQPEIRLGIMPGGGATQRLPGLVGPAIAKELMFTGRIIDAQEALRIGLVNRVVPKDKLKEAVWELARDIAKKSPIALKLIKRSVNRGVQAPSDVGLAYEALAECLCFTTEDHEEGLSAFLEKRKPNFRGK